jgi:cobalt/nickel transport system ATP-binding protein
MKIMNDAIFDLRNVSYSYVGKINALMEINLKISQGEQVCIMGANGSGKSTLLAIIDGLVFPTSGEYYAFGQPVSEEVFDSIKDNEFRYYFRKKVGFVFQNSDVQLFSPTVFEEIAFGPFSSTFQRGGIFKVEDVIEMMDISKLRDSATPRRRKKKVCIASVLVTSPDALLLDEPTAGLDPRTQLWLIELLQELGRRKEHNYHSRPGYHRADLRESCGWREP